MATNAVMIINKLARNLEILGYTIGTQAYITQTNQPNSPSQPYLVVTNAGAAGNVWVTYIPSAFNPSVIGGVDPTVSPFLGIGSATPGQLCIQSVNGTTIATLLADATAAQVMASCASFANDIILATNGTLGNPVAGPQTAGTDQLARIRGSSDLLNMGQ